MKNKYSCLTGLLCFCIIFFSFDSKSAESEKKSDEEAGPKLYSNCNTTFYALQDNFLLTIIARGEHNTPGYAAWISFTNIDMIPPEFLLNERLPFRAVPQVITPFEVSTKILLRDRVDKIIVHDSCGQHKVRVLQLQGY